MAGTETSEKGGCVKYFNSRASNVKMCAAEDEMGPNVVIFDGVFDAGT